MSEPSAAVARARHADHPFAWRLFARRVQRHPYVRSVLLGRCRNRCGPCGRPLPKANTTPATVHVHHLDYDHACTFTRTARVPRPTPKRPGRVETLPDCRSCHALHPDMFERCMARLTIAHAGCNRDADT